MGTNLWRGARVGGISYKAIIISFHCGASSIILRLCMVTTMVGPWEKTNLEEASREGDKKERSTNPFQAIFGLALESNAFFLYILGGQILI